ncbi:hypothetical protein EDB84DRAFT_1599862 [Lactarius hengduanensis]|nr:hypothetical protein EDB84DRAFT_1599862 [Lactarius hengduanensis]
MTEDGNADSVYLIELDTGKVVCDQLVKPPSPIIDYLTRLFTHAASTLLLFHHPCSRPLNLGLASLTRNWHGRIIQDRRPGRNDPDEDARFVHTSTPLCNGSNDRSVLRSVWGVPDRLWPIRVHTRGPNDARTRTAIVDHGNPGAWHGTSVTAPATIVACANDAEVLDGMGALDSHEFRAADGVGWCHEVRIIPLSNLQLTSYVVGVIGLSQRSRPRQARTASPVQATQKHKTWPTRKRRRRKTRRAPPPDGNGNTLFVARTNLDAHTTAFHAALRPRTTPLDFSGHSDLRSMSILSSRRDEYRASQNQGHGN